MATRISLIVAAVVAACSVLCCGVSVRSGLEGHSQSRKDTSRDSVDWERDEECDGTRGADQRTVAEKPPLSCLGRVVRESWTRYHTPWESDGRATVIRHLDCRYAAECESEGRCVGSPVDPEGCQKAEEEYCRSWVGCQFEGLCTRKCAFCVAASDTECAGSELCESQGRCGAVGGRCVANSSAACRASSACWFAGLCYARDGDCVAVDSADCKRSSICSDNGRCSALEGACFAVSDGDCVHKCSTSGRCHAERGYCVARIDTDCAESMVCKNYGSCKAIVGGCFSIRSFEELRWREDVTERRIARDLRLSVEEDWLKQIELGPQ